jgi:hypothetical protein
MSEPFLGNPVLDPALAGAVRALSGRADAEPLLFFKGEYVGVRSRAGVLAGVA